MLISGIVILGVILLLGALYLECDHIIFQPPRDKYPDLAGVKFLETPSGERIAYCYTPAPPGGVTILHSHGNAQNLAMLQKKIALFQAHGYGFFAYDYPGYGQSSGQPAESGCYEAVEAAWQFLTVTQKIPPATIVIHGFSVGTGPATYLAVRHSEAKALVLEAPFSSTFAVAGVGWFPGNRFPSIDRIGKLQMPLWIVHGTRDFVIPQFHGRRLFRAAPEPKFFWSLRGAGHNNIMKTAWEQYWVEWDKFCRRK